MGPSFTPNEVSRPGNQSRPEVSKKIVADNAVEPDANCLTEHGKEIGDYHDEIVDSGATHLERFQGAGGNVDLRATSGERTDGRGFETELLRQSGAIAVVEVPVSMANWNGPWPFACTSTSRSGFARLASRIGTSALADRPRRSIRLGSSKRISQS